MRRRHHALAASLLIIGTLYLFLQHQDRLSELRHSKLPIEGPGPDYSGSTVPGQIPHTTGDDEKKSSTPITELDLSDRPFASTTPIAPLLDPGELSPATKPHEFDDAPFLPPSTRPVSPPDTDTSAQPFKAEYPFQNDLTLDLPITLLKGLSNHRPHNYDPDGPPSYAYATFMATRNPSLKDPYYLAIHSLIYRVLWSPHSKSAKYPFIVFVADFVTPEQRELLTGAGAVVRELSPLEWNPNVPGVQSRWKDLFAKLNMWNETEFERILFLDADAFPLRNIDNMFTVAPVRNCLESKLQLDDFLADGTPVCEPYIFAGVPQDPSVSLVTNLNVGSMIITPSKRMHQRLLQNYGKTDKYDCMMAEQAFLNWQFSPDGGFPATPLEREWGGFFPQDDEEEKLRVVHEKIWVGKGWPKRNWDRTWEDMLAFYASDDFLDIRKV